MSICFPLSLAGKGGVATTLTDGLIDWWEDADLVGKHASNSLPATPGPTIAGAHGLNAWDISGSTNCASILNSLLGHVFPGSGANTSHSIFAYTRRQSDAVTQLWKTTNLGGAYGHYLNAHFAQRVEYKTYGGGGATAPFNNDVWYIMGYTFEADGDVTKAYVNAWNWQTRTQNPGINGGASWDQLMAKAGLDVDTFAIWDRALTPDEMMTMRGGGAGADFLTYSQL